MSEGAQDVDWPEGFPRTPPEEREPYPHNFRVDVQTACRNILQELDRWGAVESRIETAAPHLSNSPNIPYQRANPDDSGVVAYYTREEQPRAAPCDRWDNLRDNAQAIAKYLNTIRALDRYGVQTVDDVAKDVTQVYDVD